MKNICLCFCLHCFIVDACCVSLEGNKGKAFSTTNLNLMEEMKQEFSLLLHHFVWHRHCRKVIGYRLSYLKKNSCMQHKNKQVNYELWREAQAYGDIQLMPFVDYYTLISLKTIAICIMGVCKPCYIYSKTNFPLYRLLQIAWFIVNFMLSILFLKSK